MKRDFRPFENRTAVTKEERPRQCKICAAIVKDKAARLRGANDNFLITVRLSGSFVPYYNKFWLEAQHPAGLPFRLMPKLQ